PRPIHSGRCRINQFRHFTGVGGNDGRCLAVSHKRQDVPELSQPICVNQERPVEVSDQIHDHFPAGRTCTCARTNCDSIFAFIKSCQGCPPVIEGRFSHL